MLLVKDVSKPPVVDVEVEEEEEKENQPDPPEEFDAEVDVCVVDEVKQVVCDVCRIEGITRGLSRRQSLPGRRSASCPWWPG